MPKVSVVVPARDAAATLPGLLAALQAQDRAPDEVLVVDNGSRDDTAAIAERAGVTVLRRPRGAGPGVARDDGVAAASGERIAFTDADCAPEPGWLAAALVEDADLVSGPVLPPPGAEPGPWDRLVRVTGPGALFETANLVIRRGTYDRAGPFGAGVEDAAREAPFGEDTRWAWRALRSGASTAWAPEAVVRHVVTPRSAARYVRDRRRLALFPRLVADVPELREAALTHDLFLTPRTAALDLALLAGTAAAVTRNPKLLALAAPYAANVAADALDWGVSRAAKVAAVGVAADLAGAVALARGSARARTPVL